MHQPHEFLPRHVAVPEDSAQRGFSCPLAAVVGSNPEACALAEELVAGVEGAPVEECCDR